MKRNDKNITKDHNKTVRTCFEKTSKYQFVYSKSKEGFW
jgi:hypothetical protein